MIRVKDGQRILEFEGEELGSSSSKREDSLRWIEFTLYRTEESGQYILSRVGHSKVYHLSECEVSQRSRLDESLREEVREDDVPCVECNPHLSNLPFVSFERQKYWARVYATPEDVIVGLTKTDPRSGNSYMTSVAKRLLEDAGQVDDELYEANSVEVIR